MDTIRGAGRAFAFTRTSGSELTPNGPLAIKQKLAQISKSSRTRIASKCARKVVSTTTATWKNVAFMPVAIQRNTLRKDARDTFVAEKNISPLWLHIMVDAVSVVASRIRYSLPWITSTTMGLRKENRRKAAAIFTGELSETASRLTFNLRAGIATARATIEAGFVPTLRNVPPCSN